MKRKHEEPYIAPGPFSCFLSDTGFFDHARKSGYLDTFDFALLRLTSKEAHEVLRQFAGNEKPARALLTLCSITEMVWLADSKTLLTTDDFFYSFVARPRAEWDYDHIITVFGAVFDRAPILFLEHCITTLQETSGFSFLAGNISPEHDFFEPVYKQPCRVLVPKGTSAMKRWFKKRNDMVDRFGFAFDLKHHIAEGEWDTVRAILPLCAEIFRKNSTLFLCYDHPIAVECFLKCRPEILLDVVSTFLFDLKNVKRNVKLLTALLATKGNIEPFRYRLRYLRREDPHQTYPPEIRAILEQYSLL